MKETILQNIDLSSEIIVFDQQTRQAELTLTNKHSTLSTVFKIKATKLGIIDVKPAKGFIKSQGKVTINFKFVANMVPIPVTKTPNEMQATENNHKFMIQFLNITNQEATKEQVENIWKAHKNGTANLEHGYGCYRVLMNLTGKKRLAVSDVKSKTANSEMYKSVGRSLGGNDIEGSAQKDVNDEELSRKYTELKEKQAQLLQERQRVFKHTGGPVVKSKGGKLKAYIVFTGNYLRSSMVRVKHHQKIKQEKKSFFSFFQ